MALFLHLMFSNRMKEGMYYDPKCRSKSGRGNEELKQARKFYKRNR